jgi:hypothetical protein
MDGKSGSAFVWQDLAWWWNFQKKSF